MEKRKVQKTGGSTYIVSLPKDWARGRIEEGDSLWIREEESSLTLLVERAEEREREINLSWHGSVGSMLRKVIANYLSGYDLIKVEFPGPEKRKELESLIKQKIMGLEVMRESGGEVELRNLLNYKDLTFRQVLQRMDSLLNSMHEDLIKEFEGEKETAPEDIDDRENEVDKLYLLGVRQLGSAAEGREMMKKLGIETKSRLPGYRVILKNLERVGDHLKKIASILSQEEIDPKKLKGVGKKSFEAYQKSVESLFEVDVNTAESSIQRSKKVDSLSEEVHKQISSEPSLVYEIILDSFERIRKLSRDIAEVTINFSASKGKTF